MITVIDYGLGNIGSLKNMLRRLNKNVLITSKPKHVLNSKKLIIPGVGSFDKAISNIDNVIGLREALNVKALNDKIPMSLFHHDFLQRDHLNLIISLHYIF